MKKIMKSLAIISLMIASTTAAWGSASRIEHVDQWTSADETKTWTPPAASDTIVGRASTDTLTNKTISGASNTLSNISASSISSGTASVSVGGTGLNAVTAHDLLIGNGTSALNLLAPGTSGFVLTSNGASADPTYQAIPSTAPSLNGGSASPESVSAAGGVTLSSISTLNEVWVVGNGSAVTVTATPSVTACTADGQQLKIHGTSDTNKVTLQDKSNLASSGLSLNGNVVLAKDSTITLHCDITQALWIEDSRR